MQDVVWINENIHMAIGGYIDTTLWKKHCGIT